MTGCRELVRNRIPVSEPNLSGNEKKYVLDCLESSWVSSSGKYIKLFEEQFADYLGVKHAIAVSNGTVALHLALLALGVGPGDEVIVPTFTYIATANAVTYVGATPVFIDCEPDTWCMDVDNFIAKITPNTKAVIPVHIYGHPCDMNPIMEAAEKHGIEVIEDAAEALGSKYNNRLIGTFGKISTYSFYGNKTITTGEGGMVVCNDDGLDKILRLYKGQGMNVSKRYWFDVVGYNYRMTNIQAAIGLAQLERIDHLVERKRVNAIAYKSALKDISGITLPVELPYAYNSYWMYSILVKSEFGMTRNEIMEKLEERGIETRPFFYPMHLLPPYEKIVAGSNFPVASAIAASGINLPSSTKLNNNIISEIADELSSLLLVD